MTTNQEQVTLHRLSVVARGCRGDITDNELLTAVIADAAKASGLSIINEAVHAFTPHGFSIALLLAQSHLVFSTWPEYATVMLDLTVCADRGTALTVWQEIRDHLLPITHEINEQDVVIFAPTQNPHDLTPTAEDDTHKNHQRPDRAQRLHHHDQQQGARPHPNSQSRPTD